MYILFLRTPSQRSLDLKIQCITKKFYFLNRVTYVYGVLALSGPLQNSSLLAHSESDPITLLNVVACWSNRRLPPLEA